MGGSALAPLARVGLVQTGRQVYRVSYRLNGVPQAFDTTDPEDAREEALGRRHGWPRETITLSNVSLVPLLPGVDPPTRNLVLSGRGYGKTERMRRLAGLRSDTIPRVICPA